MDSATKSLIEPKFLKIPTLNLEILLNMTVKNPLIWEIFPTFGLPSYGIFECFHHATL